MRGDAPIPREPAESLPRELLGSSSGGPPTGAGPAWEDRPAHGFWAALWHTWRDSVFQPVPFFRVLPPRGGIGPALGYWFIITAISAFFSVYWGVLESVLSGEESAAVLITSGAVFYLVALPINIGALFVSAAIVHVGFFVAGAGRQGFEATFRALAYSSGPWVFAIFPFFGLLLGFIWSPVVMFIGLREVQRTTNGRTTLGLLIPLAGFTLLFFLLFIILALLIQMTDLGQTLP